MSERRSITATNLELFFPEKSVTERHVLAKVSFKNFAMDIMKAFIAWFMSEERF